VSERPWSSTAPPGEFAEYIAEKASRIHPSRGDPGAPRAAFGAVTVTSVLRAGLTVPLFPILRLSSAFFARSAAHRFLNNIVQTRARRESLLAASCSRSPP